MNNNWYRRKTWSKTDEAEFFINLNRARKYNQAQFLRVQAIELIEAGNKDMLTVAETLLNKILVEYPENRIEKSQAYNSLGEIYKIRKNYDKAIEYFKKALEFEKEFPHVITTAYLNFSEVVIQSKRIDLYDEVQNLLLEKIAEKSLKFPIQNYIIYSSLSVISKFKNDLSQATFYATLAEKNAIAQTNTLWNSKKKRLGVIKNRLGWLDKLVNGQ